MTAELTAYMTAMSFFPSPCSQARYWRLQLTGTTAVAVPVLAGAAVDAVVGAAAWLHAVSQVTLGGRAAGSAVASDSAG